MTQIANYTKQQLAPFLLSTKSLLHFLKSQHTHTEESRH